MRRSALPCHAPVGQQNVLLGEMPQEFWFYARFPFDLRRIASAPFFLWHKRPLDRGGAGAFFARHGWQLPNQRRHFAAARTFFRDVPAGLAGRLEHDP
jgi:hypothetical protein